VSLPQHFIFNRYRKDSIDRQGLKQFLYAKNLFYREREDSPLVSFTT
jgi:hypothetical protein